MPKFMRLLPLTLLALFALTLSLSPTNALAKKNHSKSKVQGTITAIDTTAGTVTILNAKTNTPVTVTVDSSTRIRHDRTKHATLADLVVGDRAKAKFNADTMLAKRIRASGPKLIGTITAVNTTLSTVTIQPTSGSPVTLTVTNATKIKRDHKKAALTSLVVGDSAKAKYNAQTLQASKIHASAP